MKQSLVFDKTVGQARLNSFLPSNISATTALQLLQAN